MKILTLTIIGALFIIFVGTPMHFAYEASGYNFIVGSFSPINESVWEHLKMAFFPSILWILLEMTQLRKTVNNYFVSKAVAAYTMVFLIPIIYYTYTAFMEDNIIIDIGSFFIAVIIGQIGSYLIFNRTKKSKVQKYSAITALVILGILFVVFTFYPPHIDLFLDSNTCTYGIFKNT